MIVGSSVDGYIASKFAAKTAVKDIITIYIKMYICNRACFKLN